MRARLTSLALAMTIVAGSAALASPALGQIRASELATMSQTIDGTKLALEYSRPRMRGRDTLFGKYDMRWGMTWTPGANWATTLDVNRPITVDGHPIPKGKYSMWFTLNGPNAWTFVLDRRAHMYHEERPDSNARQIRFPVRVEDAPFTEVLTWSMPAVRIDGGTLAFQWERKRVELNVKVEPSLVMTMAKGDAAAYVGDYTSYDLDDKGKPGKPSKFIAFYDDADSTFKGRFEPDDPYFKTFALIRVAPDWFTLGIYDHGVVYEVLRPDMILEFTRAKGKAMSYVVRDQDDRIIGKGTRNP